MGPAGPVAGSIFRLWREITVHAAAQHGSARSASNRCRMRRHGIQQSCSRMGRLQPLARYWEDHMTPDRTMSRGTRAKAAALLPCAIALALFLSGAGAACARTRRRSRLLARFTPTVANDGTLTQPIADDPDTGGGAGFVRSSASNSRSSMPALRLARVRWVRASASASSIPACAEPVPAAQPTWPTTGSTWPERPTIPMATMCSSTAPGSR